MSDVFLVWAHIPSVTALVIIASLVVLGMIAAAISWTRRK